MTTPEERQTERKRVIRHENRVQGVRYSFVVLSVLCLLLGAGSYLYTNFRSAQQVEASNHKFCRLIDASLAGQPIPKPADPKKYPARAKLYHNYIIVHDLGVDLGCIKK
jgi:hypothetical protein